MPLDRSQPMTEADDPDRLPRRSDATPPAPRWYERPAAIGAVLGFQALCLAILLFDVSREMLQFGWGALVAMNLLPELLAALGLGGSMPFMAAALVRMRARQDQLERGLSVASGALSGMIEGYFATWGLTPAEQAVATYTIKGYAIAEVATLRGSAEGTVKTHLNAIYRKAGVAGRTQLVSLLIEDLMRGPLVEPARPRQ